MIAVDDFKLNDDGRAWLISEIESIYSVLDRPCDTCGGSGNETMDSMLAIGVPGGQFPIGPCPDCIDGRHTFELEVECTGQLVESDRGGLICNGGCADRPPAGVISRRVAVVPGMVVPIITGHPYGPFSYVDGYLSLQSSGRAQCWQIDGVQDSTVVTLPSGARPGRWAVKLRVAS